ncbi:MAG: acido-empty-quinoprotein group A [Acidobacteriaceae bacterium]
MHRTHSSLVNCLVALILGATIYAQAPSRKQNASLETDWPTYNGDYSGRRFAALNQIDRNNVGDLTVAWAFQINGPADAALKSTPLVVDGIMYFTVPDRVWAIDARSGREIWHYVYPQNGGNHIGQRGVAIYKDLLYFETPDAHLLCLTARDGTVKWNVELADVRRGYWATMAPLVIHNHVIAGISGDENNLPGFLESVDPLTGQMQWKWNSIPKPGDPAANTWPGMTEPGQYGGGMTWMTGTYDAGLNLLYWGTANPTPVFQGVPRRGNNLYTCSIVAINPDTGKLQWYFQVSPHDTHDWDAVMTPMLVDAEFHGSKRKLLVQASRNGYFFVLDRVNGKCLLSVPYMPINWSAGTDKSGHPMPKASKDPSIEGTLVEPDTEGTTNWMAPSLNPETKLVYVSARQSYALYFADDSKHPEGFAGQTPSLWSHSTLKALDLGTGKAVWEHDLGPGKDYAGILSTAGGIVFTADNSGNLIALDAKTGTTLWHMYGGSFVASSPMTYEIDGRQYIAIGANHVLYAFVLPKASSKR